MPSSSLNLAGAAESYRLAYGWSIIPIYGDTRPGNEKAAAVAWKPFQTRQPTAGQHKHWFADTERTGGLAVITGCISSLAVLDFDSQDTWEAFQAAHPHLTETRTTRTPNGWHLLFRLPPMVNIATDKAGQGVDLLVEGCYAILPTTRFSDQVYKVERGGQLYTLTQADANAIMAFVCERYPAAASTDTSAPEATVADAEAPTVAPPPISEAELRGLYRSLAAPGHRNNALFHAALTARDAGWLDHETIRVLAPLHMDNTLPSSHESPAQRYGEAVRTIRSAFSRPPRSMWKKPHRHLPNTVKEALLRLKHTHVLRVITGLRLLGVRDGEHVTRQIAMAILGDIVPEYSICKAFAATTPDGRPLFETIINQISPDLPPSTPHTPDGVASAAAAGHVSKCLETRLTNSTLSFFTRPSHWKRLPTDLELCEKLGVPYSRIADPLTLSDIQDAKATRVAVHREFIRRVPGIHRRGLLAWRTGVCERTTNRYDAAIPELHILPTYTARPLHADNLAEIPDFEVGGLFLQDDTGQRYPAQQGIAKRLIGQGRRMMLLRQGFNYYYLGLPFETPPLDEDLVLVSQRCSPQHYQRALQRRLSVPSGVLAGSSSINTPDDTSKPLETVPEPTQDALVVRQPSVPRALVQLPKPPPGKYRRKLRDGVLEDRANGLKRRLNELTDNAKHQLSIVAARRLVHQYGWRVAWRAYHIVNSRHQKGAVDNPAGFLTVVARSTWKARQQQIWAF